MNRSSMTRTTKVDNNDKDKTITSTTVTRKKQQQ